MGDGTNLFALVRETVARHAMFVSGQTVVVGVSGGADSTALLHALASLREAWGLSLVVAHLNHGFRGVEADGDAAYVAALATRLDLPCRVERLDVPARQRRRHLSAQEAAREARHAFLNRVADEAGAARIALGHTQDDRIETILLNLLRGTGLEGLGGFPPVQGRIVRPLYAVAREETEAYCRAHILAPREDSSNKKIDYRRNRLRAELLPYLRTYYNARIDDVILRMAELTSADNELLNHLAVEALDHATRDRSEDHLVVSLPAFLALPVALRRRALREGVRAIRGHLHEVGFRTLETVLRSAERGEAGAVELPDEGTGTVRLHCDRETIHISKVPPAALPLPWQVPLTIPGSNRLPVDGSVLRIVRYDSGAEAMQAAEEKTGQDARRDSLCFAESAIEGALTARSWRPGDRFRPRHLGGSKKLQDLFTDAKCPASERHRYPVLVDRGGEGRILAVVGLRAGETALEWETCRECRQTVLWIEWIRG